MADNAGQWRSWDDLTEAEKFKNLFLATVERPGAKELIGELTRGGFFEAPASTKYHGAYPEGLVEHSNNVYRRLHALNQDEYRRGRWYYEEEKIVVVGLLHDVCKMHSYGIRQTEDGPQYVYNAGDIPLGHGEKSVIMIQEFMGLTWEEQVAIRWHMGAYDASARSDLRELNRAFSQSKLAVMLHLADMMASHLDERGDIE